MHSQLNEDRNLIGVWVEGQQHKYTLLLDSLSYKLYDDIITR